MKINTELIRRCSSRNLFPAQSSQDPLHRITHLYLQEHHIRTIENLHPCYNLLALYLYENKIEKIENLDHLTRLNCLYLQNNCIKRIENLESLTQLTVLNLSHNAITKLEGLDALCELKELYIDHQILLEGETLEIEPASVLAVSESLRVLSISGNRLLSVRTLKALQSVETFTAEDNDLRDLQEIVDVLGHWQSLRFMRLNGNPVCKLRKYRDKIVVSCLELEELDGRVISQPYRNFLLNWKQCQTLQELKRESYAALKPFLEAQIHNKQLIPPRPSRSSSVSSRPGSVTSSQSGSSRSSKGRSKSAHRKSDKPDKPSKAKTLQEVPLRLMKKLTKSM